MYNDGVYEKHVFDEKGNRKTHYGLIAEEVNEILPEFIKKDPHGNDTIYSVDYEKFIPLLLNEVIKANKRIKKLENNTETVAQLKEDNAHMVALIKNLMIRIERLETNV